MSEKRRDQTQQRDADRFALYALGFLMLILFTVLGVVG